MPSNDERREVAARLRDIERDFTLSFECVMHNAITGNRECGVDAFCEDCRKDIQERLADLIEPELERTCHIIDVNESGVGVCDHCGGYAEAVDNYCPNCGDMVVEE